jgi:2-polyprenyl-3-methyl-5-hydroxy-6-metoxy-1,4-benzoquinol methylase
LRHRDPAPLADGAELGYARLYEEERSMRGSGEIAVAQWQNLWSDTYRRSRIGGAGEADLNLAGWTSSYTGRPIAEREMREWIDRTIERIQALEPRRLLEIGCGMGLLLSRLAPACEECWGIDFSPEAVAHVEGMFADRGSSVTVRQQAADDLRGLPQGRFDTVVLSSVVQYFPDISYLRRVLGGIAALAAPGARIFLGDVRSLPLLRTFHLAVLLQQAEATTPLAEIREQVASRVSRERELVLDPALFAALGRDAANTGFGSVDIQLKRGRARNELTRFRYDVTLTLAALSEDSIPASVNAQPERWLDWKGEGLSLPALRLLLAGGGAPEGLEIHGVPNARLTAEVEAESLLYNGDSGLETVADLQETLRSRRPAPGVDPEEIWALGRQLRYRAGVHWGASPGTFDVVFRRL